MIHSASGIYRPSQGNQQSFPEDTDDLYKDETNNQFDFLNGSVPVKRSRSGFISVQKDARKNVLEENLVKMALYAKADPHNWIESN